MQSTVETAPDDNSALAAERLSFSELFRLIWRNRNIVMFTATVCLTLTLLLLLIVQPSYEVSIVVGRTPTSSATSVSGSSLSSLQSVASSLGFNIGATSTIDQFERYQLLLTSEEVADKVESKGHFLRRIYPKLWDTQSRSWNLYGNPVIYAAYWVKAVLTHTQMRHSLDGRDLQEFLTDNLSFDSDPTTGFLTVSVYLQDPAAARDLLLALNSTADELIQTRETKRATSQLAYLTKELNNVQNDDYRRMLISLIETQETTLMALRSGQPYSAEVLEPPSLPLMPSWPKAILFLIVAALFGLFFGSFLAVKAGPAGYRMSRITKYFADRSKGWRAGIKRLAGQYH